MTALSSSSPDQTDDYLALFDSSSDGRKKLASLSKTERTTWNILVFPFKHADTFVWTFLQRTVDVDRA